MGGACSGDASRSDGHSHAGGGVAPPEKQTASRGGAAGGPTSGKYVTHVSSGGGGGGGTGGPGEGGRGPLVRGGSLDMLTGELTRNPSMDVATTVRKRPADTGPAASTTTDNGEGAFEGAAVATASSTPETGAAAARRLEPAQLQRIKVAALRHSMFGECLNADQLSLLATLSELKKFSRIGERICEQDDRADVLYVIHKGEVLLEARDAQMDNTANQAQMVRLLCEQPLQPLVTKPDELASPIPPAQARAQKIAAACMGEVPAGLVSFSPLLAANQQLSVHPSAITTLMDHPRSQHHTTSTPASKPAAKHKQNARERMQSMGAGLTRAEVVASEAAARIQHEVDGDGADAASPVQNSPVPGTRGGSAPHERRTSADAEANGGGSGSGAGSTVNSARGQHSSRGGSGDDATCSTKVPLADTSSMFVCVKSSGHTFGLGMWLNAGRYMYTAHNNALSTHVVLVPRKAFEALWMTYPAIKTSLLAHLGQALEASLALTPWLASVPPPKLALLTSLFTHARVDGGVMLIEEGDICSDDSPLYYILEGEVELTLTSEKGHKSSKILPAGSFFGELGTLLGFSTTASAMSVGPCVLRLCKRRWLNLFSMMAPSMVPTLRECLPVGQNSKSPLPAALGYHLRDEQLLEHPAIQQFYTDFCLKEFNAENCEFWAAALRFRKQVCNGVHLLEQMDYVLEEAAALYNRYISETSLLQVNIKQTVRRAIKESLQAGEVSKELFRAAEKEILHLMLLDSFGRFKNSTLFAQALTRLQAPLPLPILLNYTNVAPQGGHASHPHRAKDYSKSGGPVVGVGVGVAPTAPVGAATTQGVARGHQHTKSHFPRVVELDDNDQDYCPLPLMFGGAKRAAAGGGGGGASSTAQGTPVTRQLQVKVSTDPSLAAAPGAGAKGVESTDHSATDALVSHSHTGVKFTPSAGPIGSPGGSSGGNYLNVAPSNGNANLHLSPARDQFRVIPAPSDDTMSSPVELGPAPVGTVSFDVEEAGAEMDAAQQQQQQSQQDGVLIGTSEEVTPESADAAAAEQVVAAEQAEQAVAAETDAQQPPPPAHGATLSVSGNDSGSDGSRPTSGSTGAATSPGQRKSVIGAAGSKKSSSPNVAGRKAAAASTSKKD